MNMGDQYDVPYVHDLMDSLRLSQDALRRIANYSPRGSLNPNGPIPVGALTRDIEAMQRMATLALLDVSDLRTTEGKA